MSDFFRVFTSFCAENRYLIIIKQGVDEIQDLRFEQFDFWSCPDFIGT
jgi:hypothetical protein